MDFVNSCIDSDCHMLGLNTDPVSADGWCCDIESVCVSLGSLGGVLT